MMVDVTKLRKALANDDVDDLYDALIDIGKIGVKELEKEVWSFLTNDEPDVRRAAIMVLGTYWKIPSFLKKVEDILELDKDDDVRVAALINFVGYFVCKNDKAVILKLNDYVRDNGEDIFMRIEALRGLYTISCRKYDENEFKKIERVQSYQDFNKLVNWSAIDDIVEKAKYG